MVVEFVAEANWGNNILDTSKQTPYDSGWWVEPIDGGRMQRINIYQLYQLGKAMHDLGAGALTDNKTYTEVFGDFWVGRMQLQGLLDNPLLQLSYSRPAAEGLWSVLNRHLERLLAGGDQSLWQEKLGQELGQGSSWEITHGLEVFEANLAAELQQMDTYFVTPKGIYSTRGLTERADEAFSESVRAQLPQNAVRDIQEAGRCLAYDLSSAAGVHILRAVESVILRYMAALEIEPLKASQRNWGVYLSKLGEKGADARVIAALNQIKDLHRNPILHPEVFLSSEEALGLFGVAQSAILGMVADIEGHRGEPTDVVSVSAPVGPADGAP